MSLLYVFAMLVVVGVVAWALTTYVPMPPPIQKLVIAVAVVFCLLFVLQAFGLLDALRGVRVR